MAGLCRRILSAFCLLFVVLTILTALVNGQSNLDLVFRTEADDNNAFEGEAINIDCTHSISMEDLSTSLYFDSGKLIMSSMLLTEGGTKRKVVATLTNVINSPTLYCNVTGSIQASAKLSIRTIPRDMSPYCLSNYTHGIIINTAIKLFCYVNTQEPVNEQWRNSSNMPLFIEERLNIFPGTRRAVSTVTPTASDNGTNYTCVDSRQSGIGRSCQVGPFFVYENITTYIESDVDSRNLANGDSREFRCFSVPSSDITWSVQVPNNDSGIVYSSNGPLLTVRVPADATYSGSFTALCKGTLDGNQGATTLSLFITRPTNPQSSTTMSSNVMTKAEGTATIVIICGAIGAVMAVTLIIVLVVVYLCRIRQQRGNQVANRARHTTTKPTDHSKQESEEPEYSSPPIGMTTLGGAPSDMGDDNDDPERYETGGGLYTAVNKETLKKTTVNSTVLVPSSTIANSQSYTDIDKNSGGEFRMTSDNISSASMGYKSDNVSEASQYATVDKSRHVVIDEKSLYGDTEGIESDYSEFE